MGALAALLGAFGYSPMHPVALTPAEPHVAATEQQQSVRSKRISASGTRISAGAVDALDPNREVRGEKWRGSPGELGISGRMMRDPHVRQSVSYLTAPICGASWRCRPASNEPLDVEAAKFVEWCLFERLPWTQITERILRGYFADGFSLSELTDDVVRIPTSRFPLHGGGGSGVVITGAHEVPASSVYRWRQSKTSPSQFEMVIQYSVGSDTEAPGYRELDSDRVLRFTHAQSGAEFEGLALLRSAYGAWKMKQAFQTIAAIKHERLGVGTPVAIAGEQANDDDLDAVEEILASMRANAKGYIVLPNGWSFKWEGATQSDGTNIEAAIDICNRDIAVNVAAGFMLLGLQGSGSYALGSTQQGQHHLFVAYHARAYADAWNIGADGWSPIERLVRLNYGPDVGVPWIEPRNLPTNSWAQRVPLITNAATAGLITRDDALEDELREILELDARAARPVDVQPVEIGPVSAAPVDSLLPPADGEGADKPVDNALAVDPSTALNGAQVAAFRQLLLDVATRQLPRQSGVEAIAASFPLSVEQADKVMGAIGNTFFVEAVPAVSTTATPDPSPDNEDDAA